MFIVPMERMTSISSMQNTPQTEIAPQAIGRNMPFADILTQAFSEAESSQKIAEENARDLALGKDIDPHILTINSARATTAIEFATELTTRAVGAYKEILGMQV